MKLAIYFILFLLPFHCSSQSSLKNCRAKSWQTFVYKISAHDMEDFLNWDSIPINRFENAEPQFIFDAKDANEQPLPIGNYVFLSVIDNYVSAETKNVSDLILITINNKQKLQLDVRDLRGNYRSHFSIYVNNREVSFNKESKTYWVKQQKLEDAIVKVYSPGDTLYASLELKDETARPISWQRRQNYRYSKIYKVLNWIPTKVKQLFSQKNISNNVGATGYMILNQPKYKPLDTVRYKAYVVTKKWKQYKKSVEVHLVYNNKGKTYDQQLQTLSPTTPGAFVSEFVLADTMPLDVSYNIILKTPGGKQIMKSTFRVEEYVLDEIGSYTFRVEKDAYSRNDTMIFFANAKDANGLNLLDATATLYLTTEYIRKIYQDTLFVADTLYSKELKLSATDQTKFEVPAILLPKADLNITATLIFKNSNNEIQERKERIGYSYMLKEVNVQQFGDSISASFISDGINKTIMGTIRHDDLKPVAVKFPFKIKIDPLVEQYEFCAFDGADTLHESVSVKPYSLIYFSRISNLDTLGFSLYNPYKVPVYYTVLDGQKIIAVGRDSAVEVTWKKTMKNRRQMYKVYWQYMWAGRENNEQQTIGLLYKILKVNINAANTVYPGQIDSIQIHIEDYKGKPAKHVNLTAFSYNNQFKNTYVKEPPYLVKYKSRHFIDREQFENGQMAYTSKRYLLGDNMKWLSKFHLDTMLYYKFLFPPKNYFDTVTRLENFMPQVSVNVVSKGVPQHLYLLYINRRLVYYSGTINGLMKYSFETYPGMVQFGIRTIDKYIEIDSIYIQSQYKHDISFDLDNLPVHSKVTIVEDKWSAAEMDLLENSIWQMKNYTSNVDTYVWQADKLVKLKAASDNIVGPFSRYEMHYYHPGNYDLVFNFEPGYEYTMSDKVLRLEKKSLFPNRNKNSLTRYAFTSLNFGDTLTAPPRIEYKEPLKFPTLTIDRKAYDYLYRSKRAGYGSIQYDQLRDTVFKYIILWPDTGKVIILYSSGTTIKNLTPGNYSMLFITNHFHALTIKNIVVKSNGTAYLAIKNIPFNSDSLYLRKLFDDTVNSLEKYKIPESIKEDPEPEKPGLNPILKSDLKGGSVSGTIKDLKGKNPIGFCSITFKGYRTSVTADAGGNFTFKNIPAGKYVLVFSVVGYDKKEVEINIDKVAPVILEVNLTLNNQELMAVVVTSLGQVRQKSSLGYSTVTIKADELTTQNYTNGLNGKVSGLTLNADNSGIRGDTRITLRGIRSLDNSNAPLYVVDGVIVKDLANINPNDIIDITIMNAEEALGIYGSRAANGAVMVTTGVKTLRKEFRDYAFWQPNFFTDHNGNASFEIIYPDNITGWRTFIIGMDEKRRIGKATFLTRAYKPLSAQLSLPQFLIEGDSSNFIGKSFNYTPDLYSVKTTFAVDGNIRPEQQRDLAPNASNIEEEMVTTYGRDTIKTSFMLESTTGFKDGEERKIPVIKKGIDETIGHFWLMQSDTSFSFLASEKNTAINIYAQNNTLDVLMEELDHLREYPHACMEQTASKIKGLFMQKQIAEQLKSSFKNQQLMDKLLGKLQKAQLYDGSWSWWENGKGNLHITNYVANALLRLRQDPLVESNIRNAFLYLQNQLPFLRQTELLETISTLSEGKHEMDYASWINKINFDSLSQHQQWQWIKIKQEQQMNYQNELKRLVNKSIETMLGGKHWGEDSFSWYSNDVATTVIAFKVLEQEPVYQQLLPAIIQYFLEKRRNAYWRNTVESASIVDAILPFILQKQKGFTNAAKITVEGDTSFVIDRFPYRMVIRNRSIRNLKISKAGDGLVYFTAYQEIFNPAPEAVTDKFIIHTSFQKNGGSVMAIQEGEKIKMIIEVEALKDADYVMLKIPIPAGCLFADKKKNGWQLYKEFYKDKAMFFIESLPKGIHTYEIELEPRYSGTYSLNPVKAELMYYPTLFGRNEIKKVSISK